MTGKRVTALRSELGRVVRARGGLDLAVAGVYAVVIGAVDQAADGGVRATAFVVLDLVAGMHAGASADEDGVRLGIDDVDVGGVDRHRSVGHAGFHRKAVGDDRGAFADGRGVVRFRVVDRDAYADAGAARLGRRRAVAASGRVGVVVRLERKRAAGFDLEAVADRRLGVRDRDRDADGARHLHRA